MSGPNVSERVIHPGETISLVKAASNEPRPMFASVWPSCGLTSDAPNLTQLAQLQVYVLIDQPEQTINLAGYTLAGSASGLQCSMPAAGLRRQVIARNIDVVITLPRTATKAIPVGALAGFGSESPEECNAFNGIAVGGGVTLYSIPRFMTKFRAWDWDGNTLLGFTDFTGIVDPNLPQNVPASQHPHWTPLPPGAAAMLQNPAGTCVVQFGRG